jgi:hypothetical protein
MKNLYEIKLLPQIKIISSNPPQISTKNTLGGKIKNYHLTPTLSS